MINDMFLVGNNVPDVYMQESRDFQLVSRLYDLAFQSTRFSIDSIDNISDTQLCNSSLLPLLDNKLGYHTNLKLSDRTHRIILSAFPHFMRYKGSLQGLTQVLNVFTRITNILVHYEVEESDKSVINVIFHDYLYNVDLLSELIEYVRPTGVLIRYIKRVYKTDNLKVKVNSTSYIGTAMPHLDTDETMLSGVVIQGTVPESKDSIYEAKDDKFILGYDSNIANNIGFTQISNLKDYREQQEEENTQNE